ncbi:hypothetical protein AB205_0128210 [Aquarana catesbeiana]|uniref:Uncharacterized protein n=1 Tax=Aquarana catesbeiana TaxID=8400 RepID=A0A2G9QED8_AQUCT|nr:hypothetical protein AB205_0128210 [Aquarana catesbeiana]
MSFGEMLEMVDILKKADYDGKKAKIMAKVVKSLHRNFGGKTIERSAQETVVGPQIKRARAVQKDPESAAKK